MLWSHRCFFPLVKFLIFSSNYYDDNARIHILVFISHLLNTDKTKDKLQSIHIHKVKFLRFYFLRDTYLIQFWYFMNWKTLALMYLLGAEEEDYWLLQSSQSSSPHHTALSVQEIPMLVLRTLMR